MMDAWGFGFEIKSIDEAGYIAGVAAGIGNVDAGGDMIMPGVMTKAIAGRTSVPMLLFHDQRQPVGTWAKMEEAGSELKVEGRFAMKSNAGREAHALAEAGALPGLSIGYRTLRQRIEGKARQLIELALYEISLVPIGMNDRAVVTQIKSIAGAGELPSLPQFEEFLREAGFSRSQSTAIAGKGLAHLLRGEPGSDPEADFWSALAANSGA